MNFWPDDIRVDQLLAPIEIMEEAARELEEKTQSRLSVRIETNQLPDRVVLSFVIENRRAAMTLNLFEAAHRLTEPYPVAVTPPPSDFPEYLRKRVYKPGLAGIGSLTKLSTLTHSALYEGTPGHYEENEWVANSPTEFRTMLSKLCSGDAAKVKLNSLLSQPALNVAQSTDNDDCDSPDESGGTP